jgi:hypothetical protein
MRREVVDDGWFGNSHAIDGSLVKPPCESTVCVGAPVD